MSLAQLRQPACRLLRKSPGSCLGLLSRSSMRSFHASTPRRDPLLDAILYLPHEMMNVIHTSVPWYAAIPLSAFITRGLLVTTAGSWARSLTARYIGLHPLRQALALQTRDETLQKGPFRNPQEGILQVKKEVKEVTGKLDKRWNVTLTGQIGWTFAQIPIFFAMAETIRQKCGARDGLLGLGLSAFKKKDAEAMGPDDAVASVAEFGVTQSQWFEPTLASEGILWFQDLLVPDPTGVLPFIVSGLMFANIYTTKNSVSSGANWPNMIRKSLMFVALLIGPLCQDLPAALMLYWAGSTSSVMLWNLWLDWKYPAPKGFTACKRPLLMPPISTVKGRRS